MFHLTVKQFNLSQLKLALAKALLDASHNLQGKQKDHIPGGEHETWQTLEHKFGLISETSLGLGRFGNDLCHACKQELVKMDLETSVFDDAQTCFNDPEQERFSQPLTPVRE
jgi:hypothetical protein